MVGLVWFPVAVPRARTTARQRLKNSAAWGRCMNLSFPQLLVVTFPRISLPLWPFTLWHDSISCSRPGDRGRGTSKELNAHARDARDPCFRPFPPEDFSAVEFLYGFLVSFTEQWMALWLRCSSPVLLARALCQPEDA